MSCKSHTDACSNPIKVRMLAAAPNLDNSYFLMPQDSQITAGSTLSIAVFSQDLFGNAVTADSLDMTVTPTGGEPIPCSIAEVRS